MEFGSLVTVSVLSGRSRLRVGHNMTVNWNFPNFIIDSGIGLPFEHSKTNNKYIDYLRLDRLEIRSLLV